MKDIVCRLLIKKRSYCKAVLCILSTSYARLKFAVWGVKGNKNLKIWGRITIVRAAESTISIGKNCSFRSDIDSNLIGVNRRCILSTHSKNATIEIGDNCGFSGVSIGCKEKIIFGNRVLVGANSVITDFDWHSLSASDRNRDVKSKPVEIGNNVWIGASCIILKGVTIGDNSIIGAGSVVSKNIPANVIAAGNPCRVLKSAV